MAYNYLYLVNRLCHKFNEVPLDSTTFASADGVYAEFKDAINAAIKDIHIRKNNEWPFCWQQLQFRTTAGVGEYTKNPNAVNIDWDSFQIVKQPIVIDTLTQTGGLATATVAAGHTFQNNDYIYIVGANQVGYNGSFYINVVDSTHFTFAVPSTTVTPATGLLLYAFPPYSNTKLKFADYDAYRDEGYQQRDNNAYQIGQYGVPFYAVRKTDNNIILSPKPNRTFTVQYDSFTLPDDLVLFSDVPTIPEVHKEVIIYAALWCVYMFRDNKEEADLADDRYKESIEDMARILIPQQTYMRIVD